MCRVEVLQAECACSTTDGSVIAGSSATRAAKSIKEPIRGRRFATREDFTHAMRQQVTRFTHGAANAEADGIQRLQHRWQRVVTVAGDYIEGLRSRLVMSTLSVLYSHSFAQ
ncbi:uncharacterized protein TNCV_223831 [Trichonephila clavipes]|nr:uncharacterized protein TNCV_223831 [Trichonephila clavipes]